MQTVPEFYCEDDNGMNIMNSYIGKLDRIVIKVSRVSCEVEPLKWLSHAVWRAVTMNRQAKVCKQI